VLQYVKKVLDFLDGFATNLTNVFTEEVPQSFVLKSASTTTRYKRRNLTGSQGSPGPQGAQQQRAFMGNVTLGTRNSLLQCGEMGPPTGVQALSSIQGSRADQRTGDMKYSMSTDPLTRLLNLQTWDGSWMMSDRLAASFKKSQPELAADVFRTLNMPKPASHPETCVTPEMMTIYVLLHLESEYSDQADVWALLKEKSVKYLATTKSWDVYQKLSSAMNI
jgi:hypothetical protein